MAPSNDPLKQCGLKKRRSRTSCIICSDFQIENQMPRRWDHNDSKMQSSLRATACLVLAQFDVALLFSRWGQI